MSVALGTRDTFPLNEAELPVYESCKKRCEELGQGLSERILLVSVSAQTLSVFKDGRIITRYPISTAEKGAGQEAGSYQTPLGLHKIEEKIGTEETPSMAIFESRIATGRLAAVGEKEAIVGRILWLKGLEPAYNLGYSSTGKVIDTYHRYIYIHGTADIDNIGKPVSKGCIRMKPEDIIALFPEMTDSTLVYIHS